MSWLTCGSRSMQVVVVGLGCMIGLKLGLASCIHMKLDFLRKLSNRTIGGLLSRYVSFAWYPGDLVLC